LLNLFVLELNKKLEKAKTDKWQVLVSLRFIKTIFTKFTKEGIEAEDVYINIELMNMINLFIEASKEVMKNNRFVEILDDVPYSPED
jgi:hypothetical protein